MRRRALALPLALLCAACDGGEEVAPMVRFLYPLDGDTVCGDPLEIGIELAGFELIEEIVTDPASLPDGQGHAHFYLNGQSVYESSTTEVVLDEPVDDGAYQLKVELANANHAPVEPYVYDLIYITVDGALCAAADG